jgi:hypothetical protein
MSGEEINNLINNAEKTLNNIVDQELRKKKVIDDLKKEKEKESRKVTVSSLSRIKKNENFIAVDDLRILKQRENERAERIYNIIYEEIARDIRFRFSENGQVESTFDIPPSFPNEPLYDLTDCIIYVLYALRQGGFVVRYHFPNHIFISWREVLNEKEEMVKAHALIFEDFKSKDDLKSNRKSSTIRDP